MDTTKNLQLDFKILVDQTLGALDSFDALSRCDALHYLLRNLKYKYPDACEQVIPSIFPQSPAVSKKQLQLLLATKKEECIKNEDENASTDLNQNFEKILCKEEFMCLDEDDAYADDADNENSSSLSKRVRYAAAVASSTGATPLQTTGPLGSRDPLDLIPSSVIHARRLGRLATAYADNEESNSLDALGPENSLKRSRRRAFGLNHINRSNIGKFHIPKLHLPLQRISRLGEGYVFHPDTEFTVRFHHSSQDLSRRVFIEQFRFYLKAAILRHDKVFLKEFQKKYVLSGRLLGTTPPKDVLEKLRKERMEEWQQQKLRKQQLQQQQLQLQQQHQMLLLQQRRRMLAAGSLHHHYDSEMDFELETESQLSSASQEIMKFEEILDEGVGPGRLIDGLVMEPEDVMERGGSGASVSGSSNSSGGNGLDNMPNDLANTESNIHSANFVGDGGASFKNHLAQQQGSANSLLLNGLTTTNNIIPNNINQQQHQQQQQQLQAISQGNNLSNLAPKEQQQQQHLQSQYQPQSHPQIISNQKLQDGIINIKQQQPHNVNNLMNNTMGQPPPHFQHQPHPNQQRFMMQQQQQQNHYNSHLQQPQNHPLAMIGGMMESANQQHQQQMQQVQQQRMQLNASNNMINSIDNILGGGPAGGAVGGVGVGTPNQKTPLAGNPENMQYMQQQQLPPHMQNMPPQQQHMLMQQQQQQQALLSGSGIPPSTTPSSSMGLMANSSNAPTPGNSSANASFEHDDEGLSHDEDDEDHENDTNDGMEPKQQLIDGGSSSSTSLQAPSGAVNASTPGSKKEKPSYNCLLCPKSYRKRKSLLDHYKIHPGYCHDCGKPNGTSLEEIIHHNRTIHAKEFPFVCETCGESYSRRQQFHAHVESHNKKEFKTYSCIECGQKFPHKKLHQQHLDDTGHKADGAICEVCGDEFPSKNALYQHIIRVHKKDNFFECHICQNRFTLKANLERHVQLHTEIKRTYVCDLCGSSYFTYPALKDHYSNAHTDASECKCTLCGKRFGSVKSLQRHLPSHSEERPHCCCYCDQTFKWKTHLVRHKQTVHGNQPSPKKVKRFSKEGDELVPMADEPGPPPAKVAKKSNTGKAKQQTTQPPQAQQQQKLGAIATPPPLSTTPGTSSSSQQDPFNAAIISNNSSQSSTASTSQHSLQSSESQPNSMYSQSFSAEKLLGQQQQQQQQQILPTHNAQAPQQQQQQTPHPAQQQQQRPTPPPHQQQQHPQQPPTPQQQQHHRHTPNSHTPDLPRINSFGGGGPTQPETQFHFEQSAAGGQTSTITNPGAYPQHQIINQYQQQHHQQQQLQQAAQQQQHMRSHTPQSPHHHVQHQQHFPSPHQQHLQTAQQQQQHQQQLQQQHHHQQMMHQQQLQQQSQPHQQRQHNQQRSPHPHQTPTQQLQQQHQQPMHSPQHVRLQSPAPQAHTPQPHTPQPPSHTPQPPPVAANHQQQQYQPQPQCSTDAWGNINFVGGGGNGPQQQQQQQHPSNASNHQQQQNNDSNLPGDKDNPNKFYIVDSSEFLGLPMNVAGGNTPGVAETNQLNNAQQQQQQQQSPMVANKPAQQQQQQQQEQNLGGDLMSFQNMWPQANQPTNQMAYSANGAQQQQQQSQPQQQQQQQGASQQPSAGVASVTATDPHNYNNIGSILTNLIDNNPNPMEYNFELMQQQQQQGSGGSGTTTPNSSQQSQPHTPLSVQQQQHHQQQQQQQHQQPTAAASPYGLQPTPGASGLIRHAGVYGAPSSIYDPHPHHPAHHPASLAEMNEQQKNSFQPYHPHAALQPHAHALGGHPLAPTAHHPLAAASHLLPPPPPHAGHHVYDRGGYPVLGADEAKAVLPPISDYMHHMQQQHVQQPDLLYYPVKND